ncbi:MAG TPA: hypothetical protein PLG47_06160, partial [Candidatus Dojkabacteria bacterium]|nr:hypothetical protein [Candidatus Dojkabacteria bacterium]
DVYTEKVDINIESEDPNRVLYKVRNNPHFREEYFTPDPLPGKSMKYFVEVDEMEVIPRITKKARIKVKETPQQVEQVIIPNDPELDLPMEQMTMRDYACMKLGVPNTFKPWLNELIVTSNKMKEKSGR